MKTTNHTPGPWEVIGSNVYSRAGWQDIPIATPCINSGIEQSKANANLIAACPDMFQALQAICDAFGDQDSLLIDQAKAALSKAKGEAK